MTLVENLATRPTLHMQRVFDAPRALVWRAWTNPEVMVLWLGPVEWPAVSASQDLWQGGVYREIVPEERLVFTFKWDESHEDGPPVDTLVTVEFSDAPGGGTLMDFTHEGLKSEQSLVGHKHGWTSTFERLEAFLAHGGGTGDQTDQ